MDVSSRSEAVLDMSIHIPTAFDRVDVAFLCRHQATNRYGDRTLYSVLLYLFQNDFRKVEIQEQYI